MDSFRVLFGIGLESKPWMEPWESFSWTKENAEKLRQETMEIKPTKESGLEKLNALIIGPQGHGKSSLLNSFATVSAENKTTICNAADSERNVTTVFRRLKLPDSFSQCVFHDLTGIPMEKDADSYLENIKLIIKGHVKPGFEFDTIGKKTGTIPKDNSYYQTHPKFSDMMHCVIIVFETANAIDIHQYLKDSIGSIMKDLHLLNVPIMVVLTKADKFSIHVEKNIETIFRCRKVHDAVKGAAEHIVIPFPKVYPVVNFEEMHSYSWRKAIPILMVLRGYLNMAKMHTFNQVENNLDLQSNVA